MKKNVHFKTKISNLYKTYPKIKEAIEKRVIERKRIKISFFTSIKIWIYDKFR